MQYSNRQVKNVHTEVRTCGRRLESGTPDLRIAMRRLEASRALLEAEALIQVKRAESSLMRARRWF